MNQKITLLVSLIVLIAGKSAFSQTLNLKKNGDEIKISVTDAKGKVLDYGPDELKKNVEIKRGTTFNAADIDDKDAVKIIKVGSNGKLTDITDDTSEITKNGRRYLYLGKDTTVKILQLEVTPSGGKTTVFKDIGKEFVKVIDPQKKDTTGTSSQIIYEGWREFLAKNRGGAIDIIKGTKRYFPAEDRAYICLDPYGNIIGRKPVNLDQDDEIIFLIVVPSDDYDFYTVDDNDAEYAPIDLSFRPTDDPAAVSIESGLLDGKKVAYTIKQFPMGPYTNDNVTFSVSRYSENLKSFNVHINPLYHLALGVSYVISNLESPDYVVQPDPANPGTNTINQINRGNRTFISFNTIWYWASTYKYLMGDPLTRGRDVLKEPNLLTRINPTFGISLKGNLNENFFAGLTFEFARGGSLVAGWHYGKVSRLANKEFIIGETHFDGGQADIQTQKIWKWGRFVGVTLDTRIFNRLFNKSAT